MDNEFRRYPFRVGGVSFSLDLREGDWQLYVDRYRRGGWHESVITRRFISACTNSTCILDVGAHIGWYSIIAALSAPRGKVYALEADPNNSATLTQNVTLNGIPNITVLPVAVTNVSAGVAVLCSGSTTFEFTLNNASTGRIVPTITIDDWRSAHGATPTLIKIDVEGSEDQVLIGMQRTLRQCAPLLFVETHSPTLMSRCLDLLEYFRYVAEPVRLNPALTGWSNTVLIAAPQS